jgi:hypothetical protein
MSQSGSWWGDLDNSGSEAVRADYVIWHIAPGKVRGFAVVRLGQAAADLRATFLG